MRLVRIAFSVPLIAVALPACASARRAPPPPPPITVTPAPPRTDPALLARSVLFAHPDHSDAKISPDGQRIGWLAPVDGVLNLFVGPADDVKKAQPVTQDATVDGRSWWWAFGSDRVLLARDKDGGESSHLYVVDLTKKETKDLTPIEGVH